MPPTPGSSPHKLHPVHAPPSPATAAPRSQADEWDSAGRGSSPRGSSRGSSAGSRYVANYEKYTITQAIRRATAFKDRTEDMKETNRLLAMQEVRRRQQEAFLASQQEAAEIRQLEVDEDYDRRTRAIINGPGLSEFDSQFIF